MFDVTIVYSHNLHPSLPAPRKKRFHVQTFKSHHQVIYEESKKYEKSLSFPEEVCTPTCTPKKKGIRFLTFASD